MPRSPVVRLGLALLVLFTPSACAWSPKQKLPQALGEDDTFTHLINARSGRCLDTERGGTTGGVPIIQYGCHPDHNMQWRLVPTAEGAYQLMNRKSRKCVQPEASSADDYVALIQEPCSDTPFQQWRFEAAENDLYRVVNVGSGKCLSIFEDRTDDWARAIQSSACDDLSARWH